MLGFLNVHKPVGCTSRDVVNTIQRILKPLKVGHAGTLDPLASGVLVVAVGSATRIIDLVQQQPKVYEATFRFGVFSPTDDLEGELEENAGPIPPRDRVIETLPRFIGEIQQVPPAFSAIKVAGKRAFDLARQGREVNLQPRPVTIYSLELMDYTASEVRLRMRCSAGTYVRSLGRDLAEALGTKAVMTSLARTEIGGFTLDNARPWNDFKVVDREELESWLLDPFTALPAVRVVELTAADCRQLLLGRGVGSVDGDVAMQERALGKSPWGPAFALLKPVRGEWRIDKAFAEMVQRLEQSSTTEADALPASPSSQAPPSQVVDSQPDDASCLTERETKLIASERRRLASELHDGLVQEVMGAKLLLEATLARLDPSSTYESLTDEELFKRLKKVDHWLDHASLEARELVRHLDSHVGTATEAKQKLEQLADRWRNEHHAMTWDWRVEAWPSDAEAAWDLYRVVQEATRNAIEHGQATRLSVLLRNGDPATQLIGEIVDNGRGFDPSSVDPLRHGLVGMRRRIARHGGDLSVVSSPGSGTTINLRLPLK